jgi:hypothetical protein
LSAAQAFGDFTYSEIDKAIDSKDGLRTQGIQMLKQMLNRPTSIIKAVQAGGYQRIAPN